MWTTIPLLLALSLAPGQGGDLKLTNDRMTYGMFGSERKDKEFLPGDLFHVSFDIEGIKVDDSGKIRYSMAMDVLSKGKSMFKQDPTELVAINSLGGRRLKKGGAAEAVAGD